MNEKSSLYKPTFIAVSENGAECSGDYSNCYDKFAYNMSATCSDSDLLDTLVTGLYNSDNISVDCIDIYNNNHTNTWKTGLCDDDVPRICANCTNPCVCDLNNERDDYDIVIPAYCAQATGGHASAIGFQMEPKKLYPDINILNTTSTRNSIIVYMNVTASGVVHCASIPKNNINGRKLKSVTTIKKYGNSASLFNVVGGIVSIKLEKSENSPLIGSTNYGILCYSEPIQYISGTNFAMPLSDVYDTLVYQYTECCRYVHISYEKSFLTQNTVSDFFYS